MAILRKDDGFITLIETSNAGTYTIENENDTIAEVVVVGAGGGGVGCAHGSKWYYADGGGGAAFVGTINLPAGTYTVTVGAGGASNFNASSASDAGSVTGGNSSLGDLIIAGGGIRGSGTNCVYPGAGGTLTVNADVISSTIQSNGNNATGGGMNGHGQAQSLYQDYGKGGMGIYGGSVAGTNGYVKVRIKVAGSKRKAYNIMQRYVKHAQGDFNPKNALVIGSPTITKQGVVSGFSTSNYLSLPETFAPVSGNVWEIGFKVTTGSNVTTQQTVLGCTPPNCGGMWLGLGRSSTAKFDFSAGSGTSSSSDWNIASHIAGSTTITTNTTYYIKIVFTGSEYKVLISTNNIDWITDILVTSSVVPSAYTNRIGIVLSGGSSYVYPWLGSIDLSESYMKVNGEYYWTGFYTENVIGYKAYNIVDPSWESVSQTFNYTGALQTYTVPNGVTSVQVDCVGATGAKPTGKYFGNKYAAGKGGRVKTEMSVTPGETFFIWVGKEPSDIKVAEYNASDIRTSNADITSEEGLNSRLVVAGAGGSGAENNWSGWDAGQGGGLIGGSTVDSYGLATGGTQTAGGTCTNYGGYGSQAGGNGTFGMGGAGSQYASAVAAGGAGWYGGAGGNAFLASNITGVSDSRGGAGGSSYTDPTLCSNVSHVQGFNDGNGYVKITYRRRRF